MKAISVISAIVVILALSVMVFLLSNNDNNVDNSEDHIAKDYIIDVFNHNAEMFEDITEFAFESEENIQVDYFPQSKELFMNEVVLNNSNSDLKKSIKKFVKKNNIIGIYENSQDEEIFFLFEDVYEQGIVYRKNDNPPLVDKSVKIKENWYYYLIIRE